MNKILLLNIVSVVAGSAAIAVSCKATKSGFPLLAFLIIPRWNMVTIKEENQK